MEIDVEPELAVLGEIRQSVAAHLRRSGCPAASVGNLVLMANELLTNAIVHGLPPIRLSLAERREVVRLEVHDGGPGRPTRDPGRATGVGGLGFEIVDHLATRWGVDERATGKAVWVELVTGPTT